MAEAPVALLVEDDASVRFVLERALKTAGLSATSVATIAEARAALAQHSFTCAFVDIRLPDGNGLDLASEIAGRRDRPFLVVMTAQDTVENTIEAMRRGADEYLVKPFAVADVQQLARNSLARAQPEAPAASAEAEAPFGLIGRSAAMREVYKRIGRAARTDLPVLIEGESGTGKELVARAIHATSKRSSGPFVAVNLAALPKELVESELYGYEKGAFTGASTGKPGQFELAEGGTLLLDEIARIGAGRPARVDVRVIAATNIDLARAVAAGRFRADLYYRLRVLPLRLPPLRERADDVTPLAEHFVRRDGPRLRGRDVQLGPGVAAALARHSWPGNVRELENVLRAAIVESADSVIKVHDIAGAIANGGGTAGSWEESLGERVRSTLGTVDAYHRLMAAAEQIVLKEALQAAGNNQVRAASLLGIHRNSLRRRLEELGLLPSEK